MNQTGLALVQDRIKELVALHQPMECSHLPRYYKEKYQKPLNHKQLGFKAVGKLVDTVASIKQSRPKPGVLVLSIRQDVPQKSKTKTVTKTKPKLDPQVKTEATVSVTTDNSTSSEIEVEEVEFTLSQCFYDFATKTPAEHVDQLSLDEPSSKLQQEHQKHLNSNGSDSSENSSHQELKPFSKFSKPPYFCVGDEMAACSFKEMALIGTVDSEDHNFPAKKIFVNTHIPFCMVAVGVQGAGKSHTLGCFLESCLLANHSDKTKLRLNKPMKTLVLHYDQSTTSVCEAAGLLSPCPNLPLGCTSSVPKSKAVVLVSPTYYKQRKAFYGDYCTVKPLLFQWSSLTADHIKRIMRIGTTDNQLYVASFMTLLRNYQRRCVVPAFARFIGEVKKICKVSGQSGPLEQRIALLESMVAGSKVNEEIVDESMSVIEALSSDVNLVIVDLTDPLLSKEEANSLFQVVTEQFRSTPVQGGKLLALDEAHKFMTGLSSDGLSEAIVNVARLMRHDGIRLAVSTQSPKALAPELLELVSIAVLHHFHSQDWWKYMQQKLPLKDGSFDDILELDAGEALLFASRHNFSAQQMHVYVRERLTADFGSSRTNS